MATVPESVSPEQRLVCAIIPPLDSKRHKGQAGRIAILGGSPDYTGAPYFSGMAALRTGADLAYVLCPPSAAQAIKSYSPELMVMALPETAGPDAVAERVCELLPRLHALLVGPGLGRAEATRGLLKTVVAKARSLSLPLVVDADALYFVAQDPDMVRGYQRALLTPNAAELERLCNAVLGVRAAAPDRAEAARQLARGLGNVTVLAKGSEDVVTDGRVSLYCREQGSPRRCGGQGDILSGAAATLMHWSHAADAPAGDGAAGQLAAAPLAALGAAMLVRRCSRLAFQKMARSTLTSDMLAEMRTAFSALFPVD
ncbi:ATP-dependent (S)-NAD(P)H-hydrate dehydratase [Dermacentor andersoni]|uniref:ATP-dependent (S)-NAD(P)H-hydrate dehydratase n=1 Tax=Dermacentor andersoni TaxID=34620 RepID=UPI002155B2CC|nr:ATP-dependent (S)-NAD(P)H-hydrate dehydratase-like [Dermacentor andersoni]